MEHHNNQLDKQSYRIYKSNKAKVISQNYTYLT